MNYLPIISHFSAVRTTSEVLFRSCAVLVLLLLSFATNEA